jgi:uncharacterized Tic20 family protein
LEEKYLILESSIRDTFGSVVWSHKIQEKQADIYAKEFKILEIVKLVAATLTSVGVISVIFTTQYWIKIFSVVISFIAVFISAYFKSFNLQAMIEQHKMAANKLLAIRDSLKLLLLRVKIQEEDSAVLYDQYEKIVHQLDAVYSESPKTTDKAVKLARISLNITQDNNFTDEEIDNNLPPELRKDN